VSIASSFFVRGVPAPQGMEDLFRLLSPESEEAFSIVIPGNPWSKSRPRFGRGRTFQPKDDSEHEQITGLRMRQLKVKFTGNVAVVAMFFRGDRQRIDSDNLMKHVCDSGNGVLWDDDSQITAQAGIVEYDPDNPRTILIIGKHLSSMTRGTDYTTPCVTCSEPIQVTKGRVAASIRFCSPECKEGKSGSLIMPIACVTCGNMFKRGTQNQKYCSVSCIPRRGVPKPSMQKPKPLCEACGKPVSKVGYKRCRSCWVSQISPDALTQSGMIVDDSLIVENHNEMRYSNDGTSGARIHVIQIADRTPDAL
jgi:Holliday junction resolvase RusA-like endonuclease